MGSGSSGSALWWDLVDINQLVVVLGGGSGLGGNWSTMIGIS